LNGPFEGSFESHPSFQLAIDASAYLMQYYLGKRMARKVSVHIEKTAKKLASALEGTGE